MLVELRICAFGIGYVHSIQSPSATWFRRLHAEGSTEREDHAEPWFAAVPLPGTTPFLNASVICFYKYRMEPASGGWHRASRADQAGTNMVRSIKLDFWVTMECWDDFDASQRLRETNGFV